MHSISRGLDQSLVYIFIFHITFIFFTLALRSEVELVSVHRISGTATHRPPRRPAGCPPSAPSVPSFDSKSEGGWSASTPVPVSSRKHRPTCDGDLVRARRLQEPGDTNRRRGTRTSCDGVRRRRLRDRHRALGLRRLVTTIEVIEIHTHTIGMMANGGRGVRLGQTNKESQCRAISR